MRPQTRQRKYLREAAVMLAIARLAVRLVAAARLAFRANRPARRINRFSQGEVGWVKWAVDDIGDRPWMRAPGLPRALAAQWMLRRRGIAARLHLGAGDNAQAWIELGQDVIDIDEEAAPIFTRSIAFGGCRG